MSRSIFSALMLFTQLASLDAAEGTKSISEAESVLSIYSRDLGRRTLAGPQLLVSIWPDGTIVWSSDQLKGGPPYFTAQLEPQMVSDAFQRITGRGAFDIPNLNHANVGPDASFTTILFRDSGKQLQMRSWHELYEANGKVIAAEHGLTGLNDRKLLPALADEPAEYLHYRMTWLELRLAAAQLIPKSGTETAGDVKMLGGKATWQWSDAAE